MNRAKFVKPFRVAHGKHFRLKDYDPAETSGIRSDEDAPAIVAQTSAIDSVHLHAVLTNRAPRMWA